MGEQGSVKAMEAYANAERFGTSKRWRFFPLTVPLLFAGLFRVDELRQRHDLNPMREHVGL